MARSILALFALLLSACTTEVGGPQWGTVMAVNDRGGWGCSTTVRTDAGMALSRPGCWGKPGDRLCVRAERVPDIGPDDYVWVPSADCTPETEGGDDA